MSATAANAKGEFYCHKCHAWRKPLFRSVQELQDGRLDACSKCRRVLWESLAGPVPQNKIRAVKYDWNGAQRTRKIKTFKPIDWTLADEGIVSFKVTLTIKPESVAPVVQDDPARKPARSFKPFNDPPKERPQLPAANFIGQNLACFERVSWTGIIDNVLLSEPWKGKVTA